MPKPGFHQAMRALTEEFGILLIFDEVKTGFRFAKGGAAEYFGITPDLATYAKAMGNGYPAAAFGGREEVMSVLPDKVSHGGTYAGNRVAAAAAVKTLEILRDTDALETIHATGRADPGRPPRGPRPEGPRRTTSPATRRCSGSCSPRTSRDRVPRLGEHRPRAVRRDRRRDARPRRDARARPPRAVVHVRGARPGRHRRPGRLDLRRLARRGARGARPRRARPPSRTARCPPRGRLSRLNGPGGMVLDGNAVRSVDRAAALLLALGESQGEAGVTELARRLGLHKSTASRLLATLQKRGLVEQDEETGKYRLGLVVIRLAERAERTLDLRGDRPARARPARPR